MLTIMEISYNCNLGKLCTHLALKPTWKKIFKSQILLLTMILNYSLAAKKERWVMTIVWMVNFAIIIVFILLLKAQWILLNFGVFCSLVLKHVKMSKQGHFVKLNFSRTNSKDGRQIGMQIIDKRYLSTHSTGGLV